MQQINLELQEKTKDIKADLFIKMDLETSN